MRTARLTAFFTACALLLGGLLGCAPPPDSAKGGRLQIVATLFPQYDFAREIAGAHADVTLLLPPGVESHTFEPTPADVVRISSADLFVYTGEEMEPWAHTLLEGLEGVNALDISHGILPAQPAGEAHKEHAGHSHSGGDPHIWTSPVNAVQMVDSLTDALCAADPANAASYQSNAASYKEKLRALDRRLEEIVEQAAYREIVFGGRFALYYFAQRYGLSYLAAFDSCSGETEPSAGAVAQIIDEIRQKQLPAIFYEELTDPKVARAISEETGAEMLLLHSCHNVSPSELAAGATYLSLMEQNAVNLERGLG